MRQVKVWVVVGGGSAACGIYCTERGQREGGEIREGAKGWLVALVFLSWIVRAGKGEGVGAVG
jgi:hypothetical protein